MEPIRIRQDRFPAKILSFGQGNSGIGPVIDDFAAALTGSFFYKVQSKAITAAHYVRGVNAELP